MVNTSIIAMATRSNCQPEMNDERPKAIDVALAVYKQPGQFAIPKPGRFPTGMLDIIKTAAGDDDTIHLLCDDTHLPRDTAIQVCKFYLQKLLTTGSNDPYLMLGLDRNASLADLKDHKRWLLKWLHPDRNPSKWESGLFLKVGKAAMQIEDGNAYEKLETPNSPRHRRTSPRRSVWKYTRDRRRKFSLLKVLKPFVVALSTGLIVVFILTTTIYNWTFIKQVMK
jgi:hypothetical protein